VQEAASKAAIADAKAKELEAEEAKVKTEQAEVARKLADQEERHAKAKSMYEEEEVEMARTSADLDEATHKLKKYRKADPAGHHAPHAGARSAASLMGMSSIGLTLITITLAP